MSGRRESMFFYRIYKGGHNDTRLGKVAGDMVEDFLSCRSRCVGRQRGDRFEYSLGTSPSCHLSLYVAAFTSFCYY